MRTSLTLLKMIVVLALALLAACTPPATPTPTPTASDPTRPPRTATLTPAPTATETASPTASPSPTATSSPTPLPVGPSNFPAEVNPLTGLKVAEPALLDRLPVLVKISNFPREARPQAGLSLADLVFESYIGAGATRYTALFYGQDAPQTGPVRSARILDASLGQAYQSVLVFVGADPVVFNWIINALGIRAIAEGSSSCPAVCRTGNGDVNSVFADTAEVTKFAAGRGIQQVRQNLDGMRFDHTLPAGGQAGAQVTVAFAEQTVSDWRYDPRTGRYLKWVDASAAAGFTLIPHSDRLTMEQLAFDNVVILFANYKEIKPTLHEIEFIANARGRKALLFRDGQAYELTWFSQGNAQPPKFFGPDGQEFPFKPGTTWFEIVGVSSAAENTDGAWAVRFSIP